MRVSTLYATLGIFSAMSQGILGGYYGKFIGDINSHAHDFTGKVYAVSENQVYITEMNYDGLGPEAYFWVGNGSQGPDLTSGNRTLDEAGSPNILQAYTNSRVLLTLPKKITGYGYIGIFCIAYKHNFGEVFIPAGFELPAEHTFGRLTGQQHSVSASEVTLKDSATIELKAFNYDGNAPDAFFAVGPVKDTPKDRLTKLLDENGRSTKLDRYTDKTVTLKLPDGHHWIDFQWFTVYCFQVTSSFAGLEIPRAISGNLPVHNPTSDVHKNEGKRGFQLIIILVAVGVVVCVGAALLFYCFLTSRENKAPDARGALPGVGASVSLEAAKGANTAENPTQEAKAAAP